MQLTPFSRDDQLTVEMKKYADECYADNMSKHNFSFSPLSIYMSGVNRQTGIAYDNWKTRMKMHHPSKTEHPILYKEDIFTNRRKYG
jgi:hypothetical protein